ncbi:MAG: YkgJ family cysteine cluster protein [Deltaproteobacteria bacterium]|nr:YkgJ family cysteine cluster protein [Deltaproteobacteria bacterium]
MRILPDPAPVFARYEALAREADNAFERVRQDFPDSVTCREGCADCCHALFDLPLVEAAYLNNAFLRAFPSGPERSAILETAHAADRKIHTLKRRAFRAEQAGERVEAIAETMGRARVRCPLLGEDDRCRLYAARPITCRLYGVPVAVGGKGRVCFKAAFAPGGRYPTVNASRVHERLALLSQTFAAHMGSGFSALHTVLVPVSMALTTVYDATYYGLDRKREAAHG